MYFVVGFSLIFAVLGVILNSVFSTVGIGFHMSSISGNEEVQLCFTAATSQIQTRLKAAGIQKEVKEFIASIDDLKKWFKSYKTESIELWIEGAVKEGNLVKLFVSFEGR